jgi:hypothetical protein
MRTRWLGLALAAACSDPAAAPAPPVDAERTACTPGATVACYSGPQGTLRRGICRPGTAVCGDDGASVGPCEDEVAPAVEDCNTPEDEDCNGVAESCAPPVVWAKRFGDPDPSHASIADGQSVAVDREGNVLVSGSVSGDVDLGGGTLHAEGNAIGVVKLDPKGGHAWSKLFRVDGNALTKTVAAGPDGGVWLTGSYEGAITFGGPSSLTDDFVGRWDMFVARLDRHGDHVFSLGFGTIAPAGMAVDFAGAAVVAGHFPGFIDFGGGFLEGDEVFVAKVHPNGGLLYARSFATFYQETATAVAVDRLGRTFVAGGYQGAPDFGDGALPQSDAGAYLLKLDLQGTLLWSRAIGAAPSQMATDPDGHVVLAGAIAASVDFGGGSLPFAGGSDLFVAKLSADGEHLWSRSFGDAGEQAAVAVACDEHGDVLLGVELHGSLDFGGAAWSSVGGSDVLLCTLDRDGAELFALRAGDGGAQYARAVAAHDDGLIGSGTFAGTIDFGSGALSAGANAFDMFVVKLAP